MSASRPDIARLARFGVLVVGAALSGCTVGPDYKRPGLEVPGAFKSPASSQVGPRQLPAAWWTLFNDPDLDAIVSDAVAANQDLKAAAARLVQARAATAVVKSQFYPIITFDPSISRARSPAGRSAAVGGSGGARTTTVLQIPFDLSYEVDVWGRVRRSVEAATAQEQASAADWGVVLLTLTAETAQDYFLLRSLDAQEQILSHSVELYQRQIELLQTEFHAGLVGRTDVLQAQTLLDSTRVQLIDAQRQRADTEHALAILTGRPPSAVSVAARPLDGEPPPIPPALPGDLLRQRPDVMEAESALIAANASVGVAIANFYPALRLTGSAGFETTDVAHALDWENRIWSIAAGLAAPIFTGGQLSAQLEQAKARYDELLANYRGAVLVAFRDVEDSLTDLHMRADAADAQDRAVQSATDYLQLAQLQYRQGLVSYLQVIDADRTLLSNQLSAAQIRADRFGSTVLLIKALGGGWTLDDAAANPETHGATGPQP